MVVWGGGAVVRWWGRRIIVGVRAVWRPDREVKNRWIYFHVEVLVGSNLRVNIVDTSLYRFYLQSNSIMDLSDFDR